MADDASEVPAVQGPVRAACSPAPPSRDGDSRRMRSPQLAEVTAGWCA